MQLLLLLCSVCVLKTPVCRSVFSRNLSAAFSGVVVVFFFSWLPPSSLLRTLEIVAKLKIHFSPLLSVDNKTLPEQARLLSDARLLGSIVNKRKKERTKNFREGKKERTAFRDLCFRTCELFKLCIFFVSSAEKR